MRYLIVQYPGHMIYPGNRVPLCSFVGGFVDACVFAYQLERNVDLYGSTLKVERY